MISIILKLNPVINQVTTVFSSFWSLTKRPIDQRGSLREYKNIIHESSIFITRCHKQWFCQPESHSELIMCPPQKLSHTFFYDNWTHSRVHTGKKTLIPDNLKLLSIIFNSSINARCIRSLHIIGFIQEEISCNLCILK